MTTTAAGGGPSIEQVEARAYEVPTEQPESDGTLAWTSTTLVVAFVRAGGKTGLGYTYGHASAALLVRSLFAGPLKGRHAFDVPALHEEMLRAVRNQGRPGVAGMAVSAVDVALWDLKAKLLGVSLATLLGRAREEVPCYGSGGFTSYADDELVRRMAAFVDDGMRMVKMKVGRAPERDEARVRAVRQALGDDVELFVDANGAYDRKQALQKARAFGALGVRWLEEPVTSDDLEGLRLVRDRAPPEVRVAAGEYAYDPYAFRRLLEAEAVDVLQADATRCGGVTGFLAADAACDARALPLSAHTAPSLHAHLGCAARRLVHVEYFVDHARLEGMLFDGAIVARGGLLRPDPSRPGLGLALRTADAARYEVQEVAP